MATKKKVAKEDRTFVSASTGEKIEKPKPGAAHPRKVDLEASHEERAARATPLRIGAFALWALGIVAEVLAVVFLKGNKSLPWLVTPLIIDLMLVVVGSQLWKKANHIDPPAKAEGFMYWVKTELGAIVAVVAFAPVIAIMLIDKNADRKTKGIATIVAAVALVIAGASGIDYHPAAQEGLDAALQQAALLSDDGKTYFTPGGEVYHFNPDCQALVHSATIEEGTVEQAFEQGKTRGCKFCTVADGDYVLDTADEDALEAARDNEEKYAEAE